MKWETVCGLTYQDQMPITSQGVQCNKPHVIKVMNKADITQ
jgi:hypothetical protein